jgi:hypothetical protein
MQSTHNTASGQIALLLNCKNFNITFSQKNISFESALLQSKMMLAGEIYQYILVGGMDEITPESFQLISKTECFQNHAGDLKVIPGEGAAFFTLTNQKSKKNLARFDGMSIFSGRFSEEKFSEFLQNFFNENNMTCKDIDLLLTGSHSSDAVFWLFNGLFNQNRIIRFKEYCGEYDTSSSFALWLALSLINKSIDNFKENSPRKVLIHNQGSGFCQSLILVSQC